MEIDPDDLDLTTRVLKVVESGSLPIGTLFCVGRPKVDSSDESTVYTVYGVNDRNVVDRRLGVIRVPKSDDTVPDLSDESTDLKLFTELGEPILLDAPKPKADVAVPSSEYTSFSDFEIKNDLHKAQTPGNGDCFYLSIILSVRNDPEFQKKWGESMEIGSDLAWMQDIQLDESNESWVKHLRQVVASKYTATMFVHARESALLAVNPREYVKQYIKRKKNTGVSEKNSEGDFVLHTDGKFYYTMDDGTHELIEGDDIPFKACWTPETPEARNEWLENWKEPTDHDDYMEMYRNVASFKTLKEMTKAMLRQSYYADEAAIKIITDYLCINLVMVADQAGKFVLKQCYTNYKHYIVMFHKDLHYQPMIRTSGGDNRAIWRKKELDLLSKGCKSRLDAITPRASFLEKTLDKEGKKKTRTSKLTIESAPLVKPVEDLDISPTTKLPGKETTEQNDSDVAPEEPESPVNKATNTPAKKPRIEIDDDFEETSSVKESEKPVSEPVKKSRPETDKPISEPVKKSRPETDKPVSEPVKKSRSETDKPVSEPVKKSRSETDKPISESVKKSRSETAKPVSEPVKKSRSEKMEIPVLQDGARTESRKASVSKKNTTRKNVPVNIDEIGAN